MTPEQLEELEYEHQKLLSMDLNEVDIYDGRGEYVHTEIRD